jgi:hypothetical protein
MVKQFEKISQDAFIDELEKIALDPFEYENALPGLYEENINEVPEEYEEESNRIGPLFSGSGTGAALMTGIGALKDTMVNNAIGKNLIRNAIIGSLIGGTSVGIPMLIDHFSKPKNENIIAEPFDYSSGE